MTMKNWNASSAFVKLDNVLLSFGNRFYARAVDLFGGFLRIISLKSGPVEQVVPNKIGFDCSLLGINMPGREETDYYLKDEEEVLNLENSQLGWHVYWVGEQ